MKDLGLLVRSQSLGQIGLLRDAQDAGYTYVNIDDCYAEKNRSVDGYIVAGGRQFIVIEDIASSPTARRPSQVQERHARSHRQDTRSWFVSCDIYNIMY